MTQELTASVQQNFPLRKQKRRATFQDSIVKQPQTKVAVLIFVMDLKIVGAGSLGVRVALLWKSKYPDAKIYLKTRSNKPGRSTLWREAGFIPVSADDDTSTANYVVFRYWPLIIY